MTTEASDNGEQTAVACPRCGGRGSVPIPYVLNGKKQRQVCLPCRGTGRKPPTAARQDPA